MSMEQEQWRKLFHQLPEHRLHASMRDALLVACTEESRGARRVRLRWLQVGMALACMTLVYAVYAASQTIFGSEFSYLASLVFSDMAVVAAYGQDFFWSLLETFPAGPMLLVFVSLTALAASMRQYVLVAMPRYSHQ